MKKINKKIISILVACIVLLSSIKTYALAESSSEYNQATTRHYAEEFAEKYAPILREALKVNSVKSLLNDSIVAYEYDEKGNRVREYCDNIEILYKYDDKNLLISQSINGDSIFYQYSNDSNSCKSILYDNSYYTLVYDEKGNVIGLNNDKNELVAKYTYNKDNSCNVLGLARESQWMDMSYDSNFIGNKNPFRANGNYYDSISGYYMIDGCFYNVENHAYLMDEKVIFEKMSTRNVLASTPVEFIDQTVVGYLSMPTYGQSMNYSSTWYSSLGTVELIARLLYGECIKVEDEAAVTWELVNRLSANWSGFYGTGKSNTLWNIGTRSGAYAAIIGNESNTEASRQPYVTTSRWIQATWYAVALNYDQTRSDLTGLVYKPTGIDKQCYHVATTLYQSFTGTTTSTLKYNNYNVNSVVIAYTGYSNITSANTIAYFFNEVSELYNVFYTYTSELGILYTID